MAFEEREPTERLAYVAFEGCEPTERLAYVDFCGIFVDKVDEMSVPFRVGLGFDTHCLGNGGPIRIGGIDVPSEVHAIGHSDADVLLHAITDALLGSVAEPDIGRLFPDTADENRGRNSEDFLLEAVRRVRASGHEIGNVDCVILAQQPKFAPYIDRMRSRIAEVLDIPVENVGLKAKTGEGVGPIGHAEAIAARCVTLIYRTTGQSPADPPQ